MIRIARTVFVDRMSGPPIDCALDHIYAQIRIILRAASALLRLDLFAYSRFLFPQLGSEFGAEVFGLEHLANLNLSFLEGRALEPFDRFVQRFTFPQPKARYQFLSFSERSIDHGFLAG